MQVEGVEAASAEFDLMNPGDNPAIKVEEEAKLEVEASPEAAVESKTDPDFKKNLQNLKSNLKKTVEELRNNKSDGKVEEDLQQFKESVHQTA